MNKICNGEEITKELALKLYYEPLEKLSCMANEISRNFCGNQFDICTIVNGKSGNCSEDCKFCAQSSHNSTSADTYPLLPKNEILHQAEVNHKQGIMRYSIVTSGRNLSDGEVDEMCETIKAIKNEVGISICTSFGLLDQKQYRKLKKAGVERVHNNLETSQNFFEKVCTTHTYEDKIMAIKAAQNAGLEVCSGGIMGLGETVEDRIDMALTLRRLGIKSVPINVLNPILGTPFEKNEKLKTDEVRRIVAVYRFILPDGYIRLAGGRGIIDDKGESCFIGGANAAISGDMLTTSGITVKTDMELIKKLGYKVGKCNE